MSLQQAEGWKLCEKSIVIRRQALRRTAVNVLVILSLLLTGIGLLGTSAFGDNWKEMFERMKYWEREAQEALASMNRCGLEYFPPSPSVEQYLAQVDKCLKDRQPRFAEALRCIGPLEKNSCYVQELERRLEAERAAALDAAKRSATKSKDYANELAAILVVVSGSLRCCASTCHSHWSRTCCRCCRDYRACYSGKWRSVVFEHRS